MSQASKPADPILKRIAWPLRLTRLGIVAERGLRAFWPLLSVLSAVLALLMLGVQDYVALEWVWGAGAVFAALLLWTGLRGARAFCWPSRDEALLRLDGTLRGNPIQAVLDEQAIGAGDAGSAAVWQAHQDRMRARAATAKAPKPDLRTRHLDRYALRLIAVSMLAVALLFGSFVRVQSVTGMGAGGPDLAQGPSWEGWMAPPAYTGLPTLYLNDITDPDLQAPEGARITLRMYGAVGALSVVESVSDAPASTAEAQAETAQDFDVAQSGQLEIAGQGGRIWQIAMIPDALPQVFQEGEVETSFDGVSQIPFRVVDDHGVVAGQAVFSLDLEAVDRRFGRAIAPEPVSALQVPLPMPVTGDRAAFEQVLTEDFSEHPWANLPVRLELSVEDARGQIGRGELIALTLPGRRFFDPVAAAVIEQRQSLLWNRANAAMIAQQLRTVTHRPTGLFRREVDYLRLRRLLVRLEKLAPYGLSDDSRDDIAQTLWDLALALEEGDLQNALERLQRAQDRLEEAMRNGASDQEIAELMQELREATQDYLRQLAQEQRRQAEENGTDQPDRGDPGEMMELSQDDLQRMMDRIQELMEQGRMAEAMEAMRQLQEMLENMQVTEGQGQGGQTPGEQAMEGLSETLRDQQGLSDEAFRELQDQFNGRPGQQQGQQQGQRPGQQGQQGQQPGQGEGSAEGDGQNQSLQERLADRQRALRDALNRQRRNLPGQGTEGGEAANDALERAEGAMDRAEDALRNDDLAEAIDQQSNAMQALRDGIRGLGEALNEQRQQAQGQQGQQGGPSGDPQQDPLGRNGQSDSAQSQGSIGLDDLARNRELEDLLRDRSSEREREEFERDYFGRLLERFAQ
ncbi:MAG: DUF4175 domain-containing protein [Pelagimonas sp.]|jgi:uncharacterized protein (TIGR02302 family)|nr:DUF4175 domain-containing protein [Pelagimonas sp.]